LRISDNSERGPNLRLNPGRPLPLPKLRQYVLVPGGHLKSDFLNQIEEARALDRKSVFERCGVKIAEAGEERSRSGNTTLDRIIDKALLLFLNLSEGLYPGLAANGILISLRHFYHEYWLRFKAILRVLDMGAFVLYGLKCFQYLSGVVCQTHESGRR
jgi:hypothetical protein